MLENPDNLEVCNCKELHAARHNVIKVFKGKIKASEEVKYHD